MSYIPSYDVEEILDIYEDVIVGLLGIFERSMDFFFNYETEKKINFMFSVVINIDALSLSLHLSLRTYEKLSQFCVAHLTTMSVLTVRL